MLVMSSLSIKGEIPTPHNFSSSLCADIPTIKKPSKEFFIYLCHFKAKSWHLVYPSNYGAYLRMKYSKIIVIKIENRLRAVNMGRLICCVPPNPVNILAAYNSGKGNTWKKSLNFKEYTKFICRVNLKSNQKVPIKNRQYEINKNHIKHCNSVHFCLWTAKLFKQQSWWFYTEQFWNR